MARWSSLINLRGMYTSPPIPIPLNADGILSSINWDSETATGSSIVVQTKVSFNGVDWSEWKNCINYGQIPDIDEDTPLYNASIVYRVIIQSNSYEIRPKFKSLTMSFEPVLVFENKGDVNCQPEIWITKINNGDFSISNLTHNNDEFKFTNLIHDETIYVNNEHQDIETNLAVTYRYKDFNDNYLNLPIGKNILRINGKANIKLRYQFRI